MAVAALVLTAAAPAAAQTSSELQLLTLTNQVRASVGVPPLALDGALSAVAAAWSDTMAAAGTISHNPTLKSQIGRSAIVGENVGVGGSVEAVHRALVASPGHYANIVEPRFTTVGLGVVQSGTRIYLTQVFVQPASSRPAPPDPPPPTTAAPAPAATRATTTTAPTRTAPAAPAAPRATAPAPVTAATVAAPTPVPPVAAAPSSWHMAAMGQLAAWDRLA